MVKLGPTQYCEIKNPVIRDEHGQLIMEKKGKNAFMVKVRNGDSEYWTGEKYSEPFPLYPEEVLVSVNEIETIPRDCVRKITALRDFADGEVHWWAGDEWLIEGPRTYVPRVEESLGIIIRPRIIEKNSALWIRAKRGCKDHKGIERKDGEEWLIRDLGVYLPWIDEEIVDENLIRALIITDTQAAHLRAT